MKKYFHSVNNRRNEKKLFLNTVSGNEVYVAGYEEKIAGSYDYVAKCWKNGNPLILDDVSKYRGSEAYSIFLVKK